MLRFSNPVPLLAGLLSLALPQLLAAAELSGRVLLPDGQPAAGAEVRAGERSTTADSQGRFAFDLPPGSVTLTAALPGWRTISRTIELSPDGARAEFALEPLARFVEEVVVGAVRAAEDAPRSLSTLPLEELEPRNFGQEMPFLLASTPSVASYSETGLQLGGGYSYFSLRGLPQSRVNMTIDGVPLNDPEESAVYFANFGDFASALSSVQIERGAGSTTLGSAAYAGAIRFESLPPAETPSTLLDLTAGSYGTFRSGLAYHSGRLPGGLALWARASYQTTDGYRERSGVTQRSLYAGGDWRGEETYFKFFGFSGRERTELAFYAVEPWILEENPRFNPMQPEEKDAFGQDLFYFHLARSFGAHREVGAQVYYSGAQGSLDLFDDPVARTGLNEYGIDGHSVGLLAVGRIRLERWQFDAGLHALDFRRDHFAFSEIREELYRNRGLKDEQAAFLKSRYELGSRTLLFADLELRRAEFRYRGEIGTLRTDWSFLNPRLGLRHATDRFGDLWISLARTEREPVRNDLLEGEDHLTIPISLNQVRPERVLDFEVGWSYRGESLLLSTNLYAMEFRDEIAATGEQSELGYAIRRNLPESYRRGLELEARWRVHERLTISATANLSRNRVKTWRQLLDVYAGDEFVGSQWLTVRNRPTTLSPEQIFGLSLSWTPQSALSFELSGRHVSRSYLDNLGLRKLSTPPYGLVDLAARVELDRWLAWGKPAVTFRVLNLLDERRAWASGYSYPFLVQEGGSRRLDGIPYFYPQAPRHLLVGLSLRWN